ncbi:head decoration protein [Streptomyces longwoodensis]|uniref:head decoration protein n=1 Tax=Streptomyces longwoodensis TaxID=68231 RepID=UPI0033EE1A53
MDLTLKSETFASDDQSWLGSAHGTDCTEPITLDTSTFTPATHYPNGYFRSGIPLGMITATGKYGPYDNSATDGRQTLDGHLYAAVKAPTDNTIDPSGALLWHGKVRPSRLPGGAGVVDAAGMADVAGRIRYRD